MALFEVRGLGAEYKSEAAEADKENARLRNISFSLERGKIYDLVGPSGCGKSMLLRACALMMPRTEGVLLLDGTPSEDFTPQEWRGRVALVPQTATIAPGTVRDNLLLPWKLKLRAGQPSPADPELEELLDQADLDVPLDRDAERLSGGQTARVALLRTFATKPDVLLLDEVDAALDDESAHSVGELTSRLVSLGATCLRVRHRPPDGFASATFHLTRDGIAIEDGQGAEPKREEAPWTQE